MQSVFQEPGEPECAAACIAMLTGSTLGDACNALFGGKRAKLTGRKKLLAALSKFGREPAQRKATLISEKNRLRDLARDAIVFGTVNYEDGSKGKHWVVWDAEAATLRDPLAFAHSMQLTSYTEIH